jgi:stringent starvation protein B
MALIVPPDVQSVSTRPYLIRALHEWCTDNGFTPYLAVHVDHKVQVPMEYVKNNEIVLNVGFDATQGLKLGNEMIEFRARFGGAAREIAVPVDHVVAIYARENGQGMAFPTPTPLSTVAPGPHTVAAGGGPVGVPTLVPGSGSPAAARVSSESGKSSDKSPERAAPTLRLASQEPSNAPTAHAPSSNDGQEPTPPEDPNAGGGGARPTLKRIK